MIPVQNEPTNWNTEHTSKSETKKDCQQSQQLKHEFLRNEINIFEHPDTLGPVSGRIILWHVILIRVSEGRPEDKVDKLYFKKQ